MIKKKKEIKKRSLYELVRVRDSSFIFGSDRLGGNDPAIGFIKKEKEMLIERIVEKKKEQIKQYPVNSNRASEIGHPCERYLVFLRTRWQEKTLHDVNLQFIFDEGRIHEEAVLQILRESGFKIIEQQRSFEWKDYQITGHIDAKVIIEDKAIPLEIKSSSPYVFEAINSVEDLLNGKYDYLRKYPAQLTLYMLMDNKDEAIFLFKNKVTGALKEIPMKLDYEYGESLIKKVERVNKHVKENTVPLCIEYDEWTCGKCGFLHICLPEIKRDALEITENPEIENKLKRRDELKPLASEYEKIDKEVKEAFKEKEKLVVGEYIITGKWTEKNMPAKEASVQRYWQTKISKIGGDGNGRE